MDPTWRAARASRSTRVIANALTPEHLNGCGAVIRVAVMVKKNRQTVSFITTEDSDDLIVSFALADDEPGEIVTLMLLRTPKYESLLPEDERGVSVSHE